MSGRSASASSLRPTVIGCACASPTAAGLLDPVSDRDQSGEWFKLAIALVFVGQGMTFGLGYNNARLAGEAPAFGSPMYWCIHGGLLFSALIPLALLGRPLLRATWVALTRGQVTIESLFTLSMMGALGGSLVSTFTGQTSVYYEIVAVVLSIYTIGRLVGARQRRKIEQELAALRDAFSTTWVATDGGGRREVAVGLVDPETDRVVVHPGEPIAVDGEVVGGRGYVQETSLTGEPDAVVRQKGDTVLAGTYSVDGHFIIRPRATRSRQLDEILTLVEQAGERPSRLQAQADRLMRYFVPIVVCVSLLTFVGWTLAGAVWWQGLFNAMAVLLVACPCALGLATPLAVWRALYGLSQLGLVARSATVIDGLALSEGVVWDKTGTLSEGVLQVTNWQFAPAAEAERAWITTAVASVEALWPHPVARALATASEQRLSVEDTQLLPGLGVQASVEGRTVSIGSFELLAQRPAWATASEHREIWVLVDGQSVAQIHLVEGLRADAAEAMTAMQALGLSGRVLTGDPQPRWQEIGGAPVEAGLDPLEKERRVRALVGEGAWLYVGDGINDAAAMTAGVTAIAMGSGSALTRSTAEAVLLGDSLAALPQAVQLSRHVRKVVHWNLRFAASYNIVGMGLAAMGWLHPVAAALLMVVSSFLVSARALAAANPYLPAAASRVKTK
ncbi:MAG: cation-translocating P-type ATPase [Verrucomicrobiota bacterium JB022]|nr:cation-translocating P-type ATPase [Verrucomicrobiota bacterium JB022]